MRTTVLHILLPATPTLRIAAVSSISAINVETPRSCESPAPTRAKMASQIGTVASCAGTKQPTWAMSTITPICKWERKWERTKDGA